MKKNIFKNKKPSGELIGKLIIKNLVLSYTGHTPIFKNAEEIDAITKKIKDPLEGKIYNKYYHVYTSIVSLINYTKLIEETTNKILSNLQYISSILKDTYQTVNQCYNQPLLLQEKKYNEFLKALEKEQKKAIINKEQAILFYCSNIITIKRPAKLKKILDNYKKQPISKELQKHYEAYIKIAYAEDEAEEYNYLYDLLTNEDEFIFTYLVGGYMEQPKTYAKLLYKEFGELLEYTEAELNKKTSNALNKKKITAYDLKKEPYLFSIYGQNQGMIINVLESIGLSEKEARSGADYGVIPFKEEYNYNTFSLNNFNKKGVYKLAVQTVSEENIKHLQEEILMFLNDNSSIEDTQTIKIYAEFLEYSKTLYAINLYLDMLTDLIGIKEIQYLKKKVNNISVDLYNDRAETAKQAISKYYTYPKSEKVKERLNIFLPTFENKTILDEEIIEETKSKYLDIDNFSENDINFFIIDGITKGVKIC